MATPVDDTTATAGAPVPDASTQRRADVLDSALLTFARFGYRKTSMEEVAKAARISRPGLYFLFASKEELFRAAVTRSLDRDVAEVSAILGDSDSDSDRPLGDRMLAAFDRWAGRYVGPLARDISEVIEENPELLGDIVVTIPQRFAALITDAIATVGAPAERPVADALAQTLISTSIGIKHQAIDREDYRERLATAIRLLLR
jgi:AcrR family transcriptional regulator